MSIRDVSQRKAAEQRLSQLHKLEAMGRLTAEIAHDFNNILTIISGNLSVIQREVEPLRATPRLLQAIDHGREGARRAAALTQQLLDFARPKPLEERVVDINELLMGMLVTLVPAMSGRITVKTEIDASPLRAKVDPDQFRSAILNIALNARDAMPNGGRLLLQTRSLRSDGKKSPLPAGAYTQIAISDTGTGMDKKTLAQVFEPFFTTKPVGQGTGLGLSQVFGFAKRAGGEVSVSSTPGQGTTVTLSLPQS